MPDETLNWDLPYPLLADNANIEEAVKPLADRLEIVLDMFEQPTPLVAREVGEVGQVANTRAGRQLAVADFTDLGLTTPVGLFNLSDLTNLGSGGALVNKGAVPFGPGIEGAAATAAVFAGSTAQSLYIADTGAADPFRIRTGSWGCWVKTCKRTTQATAMGKASASGTTPAPDGWSYWLAVTSGNKATAIVSLTGQIAAYGTDYFNAVGSTDVCDGRWHFIVATHDGATFRLYVDGELEALQIVNGLIALSNQPFNIGSYDADAGTNAAGSFYGSVDEAFVTHDVLSLDQIRLLYAKKLAHGAASAPRRAGLAVDRRRRGALLVSGDFPSQPLRLHNIAGATGAEIWDDLGSNSVDLAAVANATAVSGPNGAQSSAIQFDGGGHANATDAGLPAGTTARSYGLWFKTATVPGGAAVLMTWGATLGTNDTRVQINSTGVVQGANAADAANGPFVCDGLWHHVVSVEENAPADGLKRKLYLDGKLVATSTALASLVLGGASRFRLGAAVDGTNPLTGAVARAFVADYALTPEQVLAIYNKGSQALGLSPKDAGAHVERIDATNIYFIGDPLEGSDAVTLEVAS